MAADVCVEEPVKKTVFWFAGRGGGIGNTLLASNLISWLRFRCSPAVNVRGFDLDPHGGLSRFYAGLERIGDFQARELLGLITADRAHSCFVIDGGASNDTLLESAFSGYRLSDLAFSGMRVVLVIPVIGDGSGLRRLPWFSQFTGADVLLVYRKPAPGIGAEIRDSAGLADLPLPLWLEMAGSRSGDEDGELPEDGISKIRRLLQPQFKPEYLVEHLFNRGISVYQAAYPYSAWAAPGGCAVGGCFAKTGDQYPGRSLLGAKEEILGGWILFWVPIDCLSGIFVSPSLGQWFRH